MFWRNGLIFSAFSIAVLAACGGESSSEPTATQTSSATVAPTVTADAAAGPTPIVLEAGLQTAIEAYVQEQGSRLAGDCPNAQDPQRDAGAWCYFTPNYSNGRVSIVIGRTFSDETYTLMLERAADGSFSITGVGRNQGI